MEKESYNKIKARDNPLKIDKDLVEIQKTIISYGEKIILEIDKIGTLVRTIIQQKVEDKNKTMIEKPKETENYVIQHLRKIK